MLNELNARQRAFVEAYVLPNSETRGNAKRSAIRAGYAERSAEVTASRMLSNDKIQKAIRGAQDKLFDENIMSAKEVLYHLTRTARAETVELESVVTKTGTYKEHPDSGKHQLVYDEEVHMIEKPPKISDQNKALELLGKHHRLFTEKQEIEMTASVVFNDDID